MITQKGGTCKTRLNPKGFGDVQESASQKVGKVRKQSISDTSSREKTNSKLTMHLDWLNIKSEMHISELEDYLAFFDHKYIGYEFDLPWSQGKGCPYYPNSIESPLGIRGGFSVDEDTGIAEVVLTIHGQYFEGKNVINQWRILRGLYHKYKAVCTRIDLSIDDPNYDTIPVNEMVEAYNKGDHFYFKKREDRTTYKAPGVVEETKYFGSRQSGKFIRIYDHDGECLRYEGEFKKHYSRAFFELLATIEREFVQYNLKDKEEYAKCMDAIDEWLSRLGKSKVIIDKETLIKCLHGCKGDFEKLLQMIIGALAVGCIDFRNKSEAKDLSRACVRDTKRLKFWQDFIDIIGYSIKIVPTRRKSTIEKTTAWLQRQVSKTMALLRAGLGIHGYSKFMKELEVKGRERLKNRDNKLIAYIKDYPEVCRV